MAIVYFKEKPINTIGDIPVIGTMAPTFTLTGVDLKPVTLNDYQNKSVIISVFPSIDTNTCFNSVLEFAKKLKDKADINILCVSLDLPFALKRVQEKENLHQIKLLSAFRSPDFGKQYGLTIIEGPMTGLLARCVLVLNEQHKVIYTELVEEISHMPNCELALDKIEEI